MASEIESIVSKEAIAGIKAADEALTTFDKNMQSSITALNQFTAELKKQGISYKELSAISKQMTIEKQKQNATQKEAEKILRESERAAKAQAATIAKLAAKENEHNDALKLEVKTIQDAYRQNKALTVERNKAITTLGKQSKEVKELNARLTQNTEFVRANGTAMDKQRMNIGNYKSALSGVGATLAGAFSVTAILAFGRASFKAYEEQEQANRKLLFSLKGNKQAFKELTAQANLFQSKTGIADDAIQGIQVLAAESGKTTEQIKKITEATVNWSKLTGQDLQSAYLQINGTLNGTAGRLTRVDSEFAKLTKSQLESGAAIDLINTKYAGFAENAASETEKLSANWEEFKESFGGALATIINPLLSETNRLMSEVGKQDGFLAKLNAFASYIQTGGAEAKMRELAMKERDAINKGAARFTGQMTSPITGAMAQVQGLQDQAKAIVEKKKETKEIIAQVGAYQKLTQSISDAKEEINNLLAAGKTPSTALLTQLQKDEAQLIAVGKAAEFAALRLVAQQQGDISLLKGNTNIPEVVSTAKAGKSRLATRQTETTGAPVGTELFGEGELSAFAIEQAQVTSDTTFQIISDSANAEFDLKMALLEKEKEAKLKNATLTEAQKAKIEADYQKKAAKLKTEQFKKQKAADIIQAIINTALAVSKALPNVPLSIAAGIAGAASVAVIAAQKVPQFDSGTLSTPSEFIAGERRPEWMVEPSGRVQLVTKPTHFKNMAGATVIGGAETQRMLEQGIAPSAIDLRPEIQAMRTDIVNTIRNKRELHISASGSKITERQGNYNKEYFNRKVSWLHRQN